jgi:REP element-mobilizing transposase RayT
MDFCRESASSPQETGFLLIGWGLMPEHFRLLIRPPPAGDIARFMKEL